MKNELNQPSVDQKIVSRRQLLQTIASGAMAATALLPGHWIKPLIEVGSLPAHAATSTPTPTVAFTITTLSRNLVGLNNCGGPGNNVGSTFEIKFNYQNSWGEVKTGTKVHHSSKFLPSGVTSARDMDSFSINGDGFGGSITYTVCTGFGTDSQIITTISLTDAAAHQSNELTITSSKPVGASETTAQAYEN